MTKTNVLIAQRLQKKEQPSKMTEMAKQSVNGNLSGFSGIFSVAELNETEKNRIHTLLTDYAEDADTISEDFEQLISITSEVKAINNQAAILHGERIKRAHTLLTRYRDGAFTAWLIAAYGNRQTPYNLWQYYEFYESMPRPLRQTIETMPRQAIYTLATRQGALEQKQKIIENYQGQTKAELLDLIRDIFPLSHQDKRKKNPENAIFQALEKIQYDIYRLRKSLNKNQKNEIVQILKNLELYLGGE
jgi:hypothetical protein